MRSFRAGFLFCGLGAGARGFLESRASLGENAARFVSVGGIDLDAEACADFERLTGSPATVADVATLTPKELRAAWGTTAPDCVFTSPPCKGFSRLLSAAASSAPKYQALNRLVLQGIFLLCETWERPPATIVLENVPAITSRGAELLRQVRDLLAGYGYRLHEGFHDCGEVGGLAQRRRRFLLVARHETAVPAYIYRPPKLRVRGCGEVLDDLPVPLAGHGAGALHDLPKIAPITWLRLSLIPPGGDWRDLPSGGSPDAHWNKMRVSSWGKPAGTVIGATRPGSGAASVADPRIALGATARNAASFKGRPGLMSVADWAKPSRAITGKAAATSSNGVGAVADVRLGCKPRSGAYGVLAWEQATGTVTGVAGVDNGRFAVADPRGNDPVIISEWDCWHRPLTTLELAALQGIPDKLDGEPLELAGSSTTRHRERIGNAVPVGAARAIGDSILLALLAAALGTWTLGSTGIWVRDDGRSEHEWAREISAASAA